MAKQVNSSYKSADFNFISTLEECVKGAWGKDCFNNCNCGENGCDKNTGVCDGDVGVCPDHYTGIRVSEKNEKMDSEF